MGDRRSNLTEPRAHCGNGTYRSGSYLRATDMPTILLTFASYFAAAILFPLSVILLACAWPWLLDRIIGDAHPRKLLHGLAMVAGTAAGLFLHRRVLQFDDELLGGGIVWFIAITLGVLAYGLSTIVLGIQRQSQREKSRY